MLCISIAPKSHRLAKVDIRNAEPQCDLVELRLDCLSKTPNVSKLIAGHKKPVLISCRRQGEGGSWNRDEHERVAILRQAIAAEPEFIDLEVDIAHRVPRFGPAIRIVSYTHAKGPLPDLKELYQRACDADADMVKFTAPTPTLEMAWPLVHALNFQGKTPVIATGTGHAGLTLSLISCKLGSPFLDAALEKGMEVHEGQVIARDLEQTYRWRDITPRTHLVAVLGYSPGQARVVRALNAAFAAVNANVRCLPAEAKSVDRMMEMFGKLHIKAILLNPQTRESMLRLADHIEHSAEISQQADMLLKSDQGWTAYSTVWRAGLTALEKTLGTASGDRKPLDRRNVLLIGANSTTRAAIFAAQRRDTVVSITAGDQTRAQVLAQLFRMRHIPKANLSTTLCDVVISTEHSFEKGPKTNLPASFLRETMTVMDLDGVPEETPFVIEARSRLCRVVEPTDICVDQLASQFESITGQPPPHDVLRAALKAQ